MVYGKVPPHHSPGLRKITKSIIRTTDFSKQACQTLQLNGVRMLLAKSPSECLLDINVLYYQPADVETHKFTQILKNVFHTNKYSKRWCILTRFVIPIIV